MDGITCIIGLGNPGPKYSGTRHNAGAWFVEALCREFRAPLKSDAKRKALISTADVSGISYRLIVPEVFMNESGLAVRSIMDFYKIDPTQILIAHDELDLMPGDIRLKKGGGHGGHNGLRDIFQHLSKDFCRLRIGIGHPGHKDKVSGYVLNSPCIDDKISIERAIDKARGVLPDLAKGHWEKAQHQLHTD